jgi:hypothetical protein
MERSLSDPKLGEVRAVLERLQTFAADPDSAQPLHDVSNGAALNGHATSAYKAGSPEAGARAQIRHDTDIHESSGKRRAPAAIGLGIAGTVVILLGLVWLIVSPGNRGELSAAATPDVTTTAGRAISEREASIPEREVSAKQPVAPVVPAGRPSRAGVDAAQDLLSKGQVQAARKQLLQLASADAADVAWMLARSFDPNFLVTLPSADGAADVEQATRWYRIWHAAAVKQGLVPNSVSVERIIGSMR